ncbi:ADP-ribose pyrophosphatase-like protein [Dinothrombium tinctorium]|uniref:ADP-ribose pyrophosphatase-like protein n=1 Tax=Dinothrombium tinctorium TaxID=1965070 RepID=A0A3S3PQL0_9ACAR|nr:ADP-ribose pyrophosphatase-like protein [Dinothrombium tinctorium]RWS14519.1 ADP-ribose pyrophosphatase-like protein [Dinothrombium tinctorium]RWS17534.1 ADP-ribose pyrophosphatase-like protein [Dinothrombium tinctorium]
MAKMQQLYHVFGKQHIYRSFVPSHLKNWSVEFSDYKPTNFSLDFAGKPWADPEIGAVCFNPKWNAVDGNVDRRSHEGIYQVVNGYPLNPSGRTGICGRGKLGKWGPNHAGDSVVTRWKRNDNGEKLFDKETNRPILQFVTIQRKDTHEWAIPGGMVDVGENVAATVRREFLEEALSSLHLPKSELEAVQKKINSFFDSSGVEIYRGIVDDPRNTDNAWMETVVYNFHDETGNIVKEFKFKAGDDAIGVKWLDISSKMHLYANHKSFIEKIVNRLKANW